MTGQGGLVPVRAAAGLTVDQERDRHWVDRARVGDWSKYESAVGTKRTWCDVRSESALSGIAEVGFRGRQVGF
jgi:hypothetical protein